MPLSEQEQRALDEMERSLYQNDADFVNTVSPRRGKPNYRMMVVGVLVGVAGIIALLTGVVIQQPLIGVLGFIVMFVGVLLFVSPPRSSSSDEDIAAPATDSGRSPKRGASFMDTINDRWDRRQDGRS
ncbi:membrane protein [marine actinobacterium PHSC20C1]|nr:membrane protein [marine actinobacterium PHSC20C1]